MTHQPLTHKQLLLDPNNRRDIKIERYMLCLGNVQQGKVNAKLTAIQQFPFRIDRILVRAHLPALARLWWEWLFWWFAYPLLRKTYVIVTKLESYEDIIDEDERYEVDDEREKLVTRYKIHWVYPLRAHRAMREYRTQGLALSHSPMISLRIAGIEILAGHPISLHELTAPGGVGPLLSMPTCNPKTGKIEMKFGGTAACTFTVSCTGFAATDET
jgi:hypothetical protein